MDINQRLCGASKQSSILQGALSYTLLSQIQSQADKLEMVCRQMCREICITHSFCVIQRCDVRNDLG